MPQDPNLYGQPPPKKRKGNKPLASSLDFTSQLTSLLSQPSEPNTLTARRSRPSKAKGDVFVTKNKVRSESDKNHDPPRERHKLMLKDAPDLGEPDSLARTRRNMEEKARLYASMKRGDYVPKENEAAPLVDFDRKWAEAETQGNDASSSDSDDSREDGDDGGDGAASDDKEVMEYEDEFGRLRRGTRAEIARLERQRRRGLLGAEELERLSARPAAPSNLIHGDAIQTFAFAPDDPDKMEELARKRDRSATPPEMKHYDADSEIRTKGAGFYKFSRDEEKRTTEMRNLEEERKQTEAKRREQEEKKKARGRDIEERRRALEARRAQKMADSFLDGLAADMGSAQEASK